MVEIIEELNVVVAGVGGQGSILLSHIIGNAAIKEGYSVRVAETYGASMRGGAVLGQIRIGTAVLGPLILDDNADILVGLEPMESLRVGVKYLAPHGMATVNIRPLRSMDVNVGKATYPSVNKIIESLGKLCKKVISIDATELAEKAGSSRTLNIVMLGALAATGKLPISIETLRKTLKEHVPKGTEDMNLRAFKLGYDAIQRVTA
jgi:indolepyruvate ferredoxin oxidoreductase beta subunit